MPTNARALFEALREWRLAEAKRAGELLAASGLKPEVLYTSVLTRAIQTANLALEVADRLWIPVKRTWRLNERHYGALQGLDKAETKERYGDDQLYALGRYLYSLKPPPNPHRPGTLVERGEGRHLREALKDVDSTKVGQHQSAVAGT